MKTILLAVTAAFTFAVSAPEANTAPFGPVDTVQTVANKAGNDTGV